MKRILETIIKLENLSKHFGNLKAVDNINIEVKRGETIGLVGPNGAGKTTTIKMISTIMKPTSGKIFVQNKHGELQNLFENDRNLVPRGFLIDIPSFYEMTPAQLLKYFAKLQNYPNDQIEDRMNKLLQLFNLYEWKYETVDEFSKGMKQKLGIIQAIIHDPDFIILDEPQTGLDPKARIDVRRFIRSLQKQGKTIFVASHLLHEISEICDKIALINRGQIVAFDTIENLELNLKTNELVFQPLKDISSDKLKPIIDKLTKELEPYLDKDLDPKISKIPISYNIKDKEFNIYYDGKRESRAKILKILVNDFPELNIVSFSQPRTSQLERIYEQLIGTDAQKEMNRRRFN
ncbi:MAG: ABC transporter ATP-binding protein [Promethearchaeia archaeon]